jgi:hypothetical protein
MQTLYVFSIQGKGKWENLKMKNLLMFEYLTWNLSHPIAICHKAKPLQETLKHLKKFLAQTWNLNVEILQQLEELSFTLSQILTLKLSTTWRTLFHTLWKPRTLWRTLFHTLWT